MRVSWHCIVIIVMWLRIFSERCYWFSLVWKYLFARFSSAKRIDINITCIFKTSYCNKAYKKLFWMMVDTCIMFYAHNMVPFWSWIRVIQICYSAFSHFSISPHQVITSLIWKPINLKYLQRDLWKCDKM